MGCLASLVHAWGAKGGGGGGAVLHARAQRCRPRRAPAQPVDPPLTCTPSESLLMTVPKVSSDLLMDVPSFMRMPSAPVLATRSLPAGPSARNHEGK